MALAGCASSELQAQRRLEAEGLTDIKLNARENGFEFTAKDKGGNPCQGSITGSSSWGGTPHRVKSTCQPPATQAP